MLLYLTPTVRIRIADWEQCTLVTMTAAARLMCAVGSTIAAEGRVTSKTATNLAPKGMVRRA